MPCTNERAKERIPTTTNAPASAHTLDVAPSRWRRWPEWSAYAAASWSLAYGAVGEYWVMGGSGFPFGMTNDPGADFSVLANARQETVAPVIALLGTAGAALGIVMSQARGRGPLRVLLLAFAWTLAATLCLVIPDARLLTVAAYAPILFIGAPFGWPPGAKAAEAFPWPVLNQLICMSGGLLWALAAMAYRRRTHGVCAHCGRGGGDAGWTAPDAAARWGGWAVGVAVVVPLLYALTRWAWALGIPLGITEKFFREGQSDGTWWRGAALATVAIGGAALTVGLSRRWGEVFPQWIPFVSGKRVPSALAIVPATVVSIIATGAGLTFVRAGLAGTFTLGDNAVTLRENWAALVPELLWPLWGIGLATATLAYYYRRRGRCVWCGRGGRETTGATRNGALLQA